MAAPEAPHDPDRYPVNSAINSYLRARIKQDVTPDQIRAAAHERWAVKTGADSGAEALVGTPPTLITVGELRSKEVPSQLPPDQRTVGVESTVFQVTTTLQVYRAEADGDYHLVIGDTDTQTMIAEIPKPGDITSPSFFAPQIADTRAVFDQHFRLAEAIDEPTVRAGDATFHDVGTSVTLTGLGFFDFGHNQRGVAPNAIELHPVVEIIFNVAHQPA